MCGNSKPLFNFDPPVTDDEFRAAALQFVRKFSGYYKPAKTNEAGFLAAAEEITGESGRYLSLLEKGAPPKYRAAFAGSRAQMLR